MKHAALLSAAIAIAIAAAAAGSLAAQTVNLFPGNLGRWDTWLGIPAASVALDGVKKDDATGKYLEPVGLDRDPKKVFSVVELDGEKVLRISGEIFGALTSKDEFSNYHLTLEYKWGAAVWPPREKLPKDSGLLYHCTGPHGAQAQAWMRSQEFQIWLGEIGDYYSVGGGIVDIAAARPEPEKPFVYKPGAPLQQFGPWAPGFTKENPNPFPTRCVRGGDHEKPEGEWNRLDLYVLGATSVHVVNDQVVMVLKNSRQRVPERKIITTLTTSAASPAAAAAADDKKTETEIPLTRGRLQLQSEGAEIFFRDLRLTPITILPSKLGAL